MKARTMSWSEAIGEWLDMESKSFTALCGESFTHAEVIVTGFLSLCLVPTVCLCVYIASWLAGGAA